MAGFGRAKFGNHPFGISDTGGDLVVNRFPEEYLGQGVDLPPGTDLYNNSIDPLLQMLKTQANSVNLRRQNADSMEELLDPESMPLNILQQWGNMFGLDIDQNDPEFLQRSLLANSSQWLQIKSSTRAYQVRGLAAGFTVSVDVFWRIDPSYAHLIPLRYHYYFKPAEADPGIQPILHTNAPPGTFAGTPTSECPTYAKSSYIQVEFMIPIYEPNVDYNTLIDLAINKMKDVQGIHQELLSGGLVIEMSCSLIPTATITRIDEAITPMIVTEQGYFDSVPADVIPCDIYEVVTITQIISVPIVVPVFENTVFDNTVADTIPLDLNPVAVVAFD